MTRGTASVVESILTSAGGEALGASVFAALTAGTKIVGRARRPDPESVVRQFRLAIDESLTTTITEHLADLAVDPDNAKRLLASAEMDEFVRLYISARRADLPAARLRALRPYLDRVVALYLPSRQSKRIATAVLAGLESSFEVALSNRATAHALPLDRSTSDVEAQVMLLQLESLDQIVEFWRSHTNREEAAAKQLISSHRALMASAVANIQPPDFSDRRLVPLSDIYVVPSLSGRYDAVEDVVAHLVARRPGGLVLLGDPGGGKTTLAKYLAHCIVGQPDLDRTVVIVPLRELEVAQRTAAISVVEFIAQHSKLRLHTTADAAAWERLIRRGSVVVVMDGLDELLQVHRRSQMSSTIESFVDAYPTAPVVVTCRNEGYSEAALNPRKFERCQLEPFNAWQITEYVRKWFSIDGNAAPELSPEQSAAGFMSESDESEDLRTNPLLLSLLCVLFRRRGYIPEHRAEVYGECTELLFEQWDRHRQVRIPRYGQRLRTLLERLAWWMYETGLNEVGVTEAELLARCKVELRELKSADDDSAHAAAIEFINHCKGRAWIFSDAGVSDQHYRRFAFTHRSFMEYFAARHIAEEMRRQPASPLLRRLILDNGATLVGLLVCQVLGTDVDDVMRALIQGVQRSSSSWGRDAAIEFIAEALRYVDMHEDVIEMATAFFLDEVVGDRAMISHFSVEELASFSDPAEAELPVEPVADLLTARMENRHAIARGFVDYVSQSLPEEVNADWSPVPLLVAEGVLANADLRRQLSADVAELLTSSSRDWRGHLCGLSGNDHSGRFTLRLLCMGLDSDGRFSDANQSRALSFGIWPDGSVLEILWRSAFETLRVTDRARIAAAIVQQAAQGTGPIAVSGAVRRNLMLQAELAAGDPDDIGRLSHEDYEFEFMPSEALYGLLAVGHAIGRDVPLELRRWLNMTVFWSLLGSGHPVPHGRPGDRQFDPYQAAADVNAARATLIEFMRRVRDRVVAGERES